jgi:hypothetical protein
LDEKRALQGAELLSEITLARSASFSSARGTGCHELRRQEFTLSWLECDIMPVSNLYLKSFSRRCDQ